MNDTPMPLNKALHILTEAHTRDNEMTGFTVETLPQVFEWGHADYIEAWRAVRYNIGKQTEPAVDPSLTEPRSR